MVLARPYEYVRYLPRVDRPIHEDVCRIDSNWTLGS